MFKVPRVGFEGLGVFETIFSLPAADDIAVDGSDDDHPFVLGGVEADDFRALLRVIYEK